MLHPIPVPDRSFEQFGADLVGPLTLSANGNRYIMVITDATTKWPEAHPIPNKEASTIARVLIKLICRYSSIKVLITDQGREFCNAVNNFICDILDLDHRTTTAYHPQSNGQTERFNQTLCNSLVKYLNDKQDNWDDFLDPCLLAYRTAVHKATGKTPFFLTYGKEPTLVIEDKFPVGPQPLSSDQGDALNRRLETCMGMFSCVEDASKSIADSQKKSKVYYDAKHAPVEYEVGDEVLINNARRNARKGDKLTPRWLGPYSITEVRPKGVYKVDGRKALVNAKLMKPYKRTASHEEDSDTEPPVKRPRSDVSVTAVEPAPTMTFWPVDSDWQQQRATSLGCRVYRRHRTADRVDHQTSQEPAETFVVKGDGNCFFRCLSYAVTGAQTAHSHLRSLTVQWMNENTDNVTNLSQNEHYVENSNMKQEGTYATEVEIFAAATLLNTTIWTFSPFGTKHQWQRHNPVSDPTTMPSTERAIYLSNFGEHFNVVLGL